MALRSMACARGAEALVLERPLAKVEDHEDAPQVERPDIELVTVALLKAFHVSVGHVIHQVNLAGTQGCQTDRVLFLGLPMISSR